MGRTSSARIVLAVAGFLLSMPEPAPGVMSEAAPRSAGELAAGPSHDPSDPSETSFLQLGLSTSPSNRTAQPSLRHDAHATETMIGTKVGPASEVNITVRPTNDANNTILRVTSSSGEDMRLQTTSGMSWVAATLVAASVVLAIFLCIWADTHFHADASKVKEHDSIYKIARSQMRGQPRDVAKAVGTMLQILQDDVPELVNMIPLADDVARTCGETLGVVRTECSKANDVIEVGLRCVDVVELLQIIPQSLDKRADERRREVEKKMIQLEQCLRGLNRIVCAFHEESFITSLGKMLWKDLEVAKVDRNIESVLRNIQSSLKAPFWRVVEPRRLVLVEKMKIKLQAITPSSEEDIDRIMSREQDIKEVMLDSGVSEEAQQAELKAGLVRFAWYSCNAEKSVTNNIFAGATLAMTLQHMERSTIDGASALRRRLRGGADDAAELQGELARMQQEITTLHDAAEKARRDAGADENVQGAMRTLKEAPSLAAAANALGILLVVLAESPTISFLQIAIGEAGAAGVGAEAQAMDTAGKLLALRTAQERLTEHVFADSNDVIAVLDDIGRLRETIAKAELCGPTVKSQAIDELLEEAKNMERAWLERTMEDVKNVPVAVQKFPHDRDVVMNAVKDNPRALQYAAASLRADPEIVAEAVCQDGYAFEFAAPSLQADTQFVLSVIQYRPHAVEFASENVRADRALMLAVVRRYGAGLRFASAQLRMDREVVLAAVRQNASALEYAAEPLRGDADIVRAASR